MSESTPRPPNPPPTPPPTTPAPPPVAVPSPFAPTAKPLPPPPPPSPPPASELTGFRSALAHTGVPHSVLKWKPRLPSRNWSIFFTVVGTISYLYYDDRRQCRLITEETTRKVERYGKEPMRGSLDLPRKVTVIAARWPEDDDEDRAGRYFRKYVKPYLVAAAIDYEIVPPPLHGSITRQIHAQVLAKRRQALGLEPVPQVLSLPGVLSPAEVAQRELEGGVVIVGRPSLKEYLAGLKRGWGRGVGEWDWEKEVESKLDKDGVFDEPKVAEVDSSMAQDTTPEEAPTTPSPPTPNNSNLPTGLAFLSRPTPPPAPSPFAPGAPNPPQIPASWHIPPSPLPPTPPILLLPFTSHVGFKQIPQMIYSFFTERHRVREGADAALALIQAETRPLTPADLDFDRKAEHWYKKDFAKLPERFATARKDYYDKLRERIDDVRRLDKGERQLTEEEKKSTKPLVTERELKEERKKKELRWMGQEEGWEIVRPESEVAWEDGWERWLKVYDLPKEQATSSASQGEEKH